MHWTDVKFKRIGEKTLEAVTGTHDLQAFVFGSNRLCLWAWAAYWRHGSQSGVEHSYLSARREAAKCIATIANAEDRKS